MIEELLTESIRDGRMCPRLTTLFLRGRVPFSLYIRGSSQKEKADLCHARVDLPCKNGCSGDPVAVVSAIITSVGADPD